MSDSIMHNGRKIRVGDFAQIEKQITESDLIGYADVSGDYNPIHIDEAYAKKSIFGRRIAHGLLCTGMISALLGNSLPGRGTLILREDLLFLKPVFENDTIVAMVTVLEIVQEKGRITMGVSCKNQDGTEVLQGRIFTKVME